MIFKSEKHARKELQNWTGMRSYVIEGEAVSPAEEYLLKTLDKVTPVGRQILSRKSKRNLVRIAQALKLWPVPDWWIVRQRINEVNK